MLAGSVAISRDRYPPFARPLSPHPRDRYPSWNTVNLRNRDRYPRLNRVISELSGAKVVHNL